MRETRALDALNTGYGWLWVPCITTITCSVATPGVLVVGTYSRAFTGHAPEPERTRGGRIPPWRRHAPEELALGEMNEHVSPLATSGRGPSLWSLSSTAGQSELLSRHAKCPPLQGLGSPDRYPEHPKNGVLPSSPGDETVPRALLPSLFKDRALSVLLVQSMIGRLHPSRTRSGHLLTVVCVQSVAFQLFETKVLLCAT